jgi:hypothetical protein
MIAVVVLFFSVFICLNPLCALASDHADPIWLPADQKEANLTGLFFFPDGDRYTIILNTRPALTAKWPYNLTPYRYEINIDTHSQVIFTKDTYSSPAEKQLTEGNLARYGGTVVNPEQIGADVKFSFELENNTNIRSFSLGEGLRPIDVVKFTDRENPYLGAEPIESLQAAPEKYKDSIWVYTGVRDDPFIFPKFFTVNVISMAISVPKSAFLASTTDWLLWGASKWAKGGGQIDHVGRSNRTQLARFDLLNTVAPDQHVKTLREAEQPRANLQEFFKEVIPPLSNLNQLSGFLLRSYDFAPDVMIYSSKFPPGFPNGRKLEDDVARITCENGDCPLLENSYVDSSAFPRAVKNDKPLLTTFPFVAEHWPFRPQPFTGSPWIYFRDHLLLPLAIALGALLGFLAIRRRICARRRAAVG